MQGSTPLLSTLSGRFFRNVLNSRINQQLRGQLNGSNLELRLNRKDSQRPLGPSGASSALTISFPPDYSQPAVSPEAVPSPAGAQRRGLCPPGPAGAERQSRVLEHGSGGLPDLVGSQPESSPEAETGTVHGEQSWPLQGEARFACVILFADNLVVKL